MKNIVNIAVITVLPTILVGIGTIVVQVWDVRNCMGRLDERLKAHIELHEALAYKHIDR